MSKVKCSGVLWDGWRYVHCRYNAKVERDGKWYCGVHDPVNGAERDAKRKAKRDAEWKARNEAADARNKAMRAQIVAEELPALTERIKALEEGLEAVTAELAEYTAITINDEADTQGLRVVAQARALLEAKEVKTA